MIETTPTRATPQSAPEDGSEAAVFSHLTVLADPIRTRLLLVLERQELTVRELQQVMQLPQSTVSRHLRTLGEEGWVASRAAGSSNWYRMAGRDLAEAGRRIWQTVRDQASATPAARRDADRARIVVAERQSRSREFFATTAGHWDRLRSELFGRAALIAPLVGLAESEWTVADLGAGTGPLSEQLAPHVARVIAIDESPEMLAAARARLGGFSNVELRAGTLESLPIDDASVDVSFAVLVLHHLADPAAAVLEAGRVLTPGGRLVIVDMAPHEHSEYRELMGHQALGFDAETVEAWLAPAGIASRGYRIIGPDPEAKGPSLFVATGRKQR
ncbi:MAG: ArsR/SmtB family transcription factor [Gemmatimonadales bacterium]